MPEQPRPLRGRSLFIAATVLLSLPLSVHGQGFQDTTFNAGVSLPSNLNAYLGRGA